MRSEEAMLDTAERRHCSQSLVVLTCEPSKVESAVVLGGGRTLEAKEEGTRELDVEKGLFKAAWDESFLEVTQADLSPPRRYNKRWYVRRITHRKKVELVSDCTGGRVWLFDRTSELAEIPSGHLAGKAECGRQTATGALSLVTRPQRATVIETGRPYLPLGSSSGQVLGMRPSTTLRETMCLVALIHLAPMTFALYAIDSHHRDNS